MYSARWCTTPYGTLSILAGIARTEGMLRYAKRDCAAGPPRTVACMASIAHVIFFRMEAFRAGGVHERCTFPARCPNHTYDQVRFPVVRVERRGQTERQSAMPTLCRIPALEDESLTE